MWFVNAKTRRLPSMQEVNDIHRIATWRVFVISRLLALMFKNGDRYLTPVKHSGPIVAISLNSVKFRESPTIGTTMHYAQLRMAYRTRKILSLSLIISSPNICASKPLPENRPIQDSGNYVFTPSCSYWWFDLKDYPKLEHPVTTGFRIAPPVAPPPS